MLRIDGRPLVVVSLVRDVVNAGPALERVRERFLGITRELVGQLRGGSASSTQDRQPP